MYWTCYGKRKNDNLFGSPHRDYLFGFKGHDFIFGYLAKDYLFGGKGQDILYGHDGNDYLNGGRGKDWLDGGKGNDILKGGKGKDTFNFIVNKHDNKISVNGHDVIKDFTKHDTIKFSGNVHSLAELECHTQVIDYGKTIKIKFDGGGSITLHNIKKGYIDSIADLEKVIGKNKENIKLGLEYREFDIHVEAPLFRIAEANYGDGLNSPAGDNWASPREISNAIFSQENSMPNSLGASDFLWQWGQFLDHDIDLSPEGEEVFAIAVPMGDPDFDPFNTGSVEIPLTRSAYDSSTGIDTPREQVNAISPLIDASMIYGSDVQRAAFLRDTNGKLKVSDGNLLPFNDGTQDNAGGSSTDLFVAGDIRANEQAGLTSMHTLFVREHNRLVDELKMENPGLTSEEYYQEAKMMVEGYIQAITYNSFLSLLVGPDALSEYTGFDPSVNPSIANEFSTAAFRLGHTMLSSEINRIDEQGNEIANGHLSLRDAFFNPDLISIDGIDVILRGLAEGVSESIDTFIIDDVRNFLFGPPGAGGLDLSSLNIQRGRDHGLPDYNSMREAMGLDKVNEFSEITSDIDLQMKLASVYDSVDEVDLFTGGLAEDPVPGSMLGELFQAIVVDQFERTRDGDKYWYENRFSEDKITEINNTSLADIIIRNTDVEYLQDNVFLAFNRIGGDDNDNTLESTSGRDLLIGFDGNDNFVFKENSGSDELPDFTPGQDKIDLSDYGINFGDLNIVTVNNQVVIEIIMDNQITLTNISNASLIDAGDFVF